MERRFLGNTGIGVSELAFGGVEIGMPYGLGVAGKSDMLTEREAVDLLHRALDEGINFFDTARMYGDSERIMGKAFAGRRSGVVLASKCRHFRDEKGALPPAGQMRSFIERSLEESLRMLQTDYLDVFMLHQADAEILRHEEIARVFRELKSRGVIRATGASTYSTEETRLAIGSGAWDVVQLPFNLMDQSHGIYFEEAQARGVGIVIRSVLMKGLLSTRRGRMHPALAEVEQHIRRLEALTGDSGMDMPAFATRFALSWPGVSSVLVGIDRMEYLQHALAAVSGPPLDHITIDRARQMAYPDPAFLNLHHWSVMGWLK